MNNSWQKRPPTYEEWRDVKNHGYWWIKYILLSSEKETNPETGEVIEWPDVWQTEIVAVVNEAANGYETGRLVAQGFLISRDFYLDNLEATRDMYWQPVIPPLDE